jgi:hypothetical protein
MFIFYYQIDSSLNVHFKGHIVNKQVSLENPMVLTFIYIRCIYIDELLSHLLIFLN